MGRQPKEISKHTAICDERIQELIEPAKAQYGSHTALAKAIGVSSGALSNWSTGKEIMPSAEELIKLSKFFGVSVDYLLGTGENKKKIEQFSSGLSSTALHNIYSLRDNNPDAFKLLDRALSYKFFPALMSRILGLKKDTVKCRDAILFSSEEDEYHIPQKEARHLLRDTVDESTDFLKYVIDYKQVESAIKAKEAHTDGNK